MSLVVQDYNLRISLTQPYIKSLCSTSKCQALTATTKVLTKRTLLLLLLQLTRALSMTLLAMLLPTTAR